MVNNSLFQRSIRLFGESYGKLLLEYDDDRSFTRSVKSSACHQGSPILKAKIERSSRKEMKFLEKLRVSPPEGSVPDSSTPLTFLDVLGMDCRRVRRCFFFNYPDSTTHFLETHLSSLKTSLSLNLHHFYPLAGKLRLTPDSKEEQYEIHYKEGDSITLAVAESEDSFVDVSETKPHDYANIQALVPQLNEDEDDLLIIQLTIFPDKGICIAVSIHHAACDDFSCTHFVKSWASICKSGLPLPSTMVPSIDRTILDCLREYSLGYLKERKTYRNMSGHKSETKTGELSLSSTILSLSSERIERLKKSVHAKAKLLQKPLPPYSSAYAVSSTYAWACHVKLRKYADDQTVFFSFPVDWRKRSLEPPASPTYFGNCSLPAFTKMKAGDLVKDDGVMLACKQIGNKIKELDNGIVSVLKRCGEDKDKIFAGNPMFFAGGSNRFGVYGADFGWGTPVKVELFYDEEGFYIADSRDEPRGVDIGVVLPKLDMQEFITIFEQGLA